MSEADNTLGKTQGSVSQVLGAHAAAQIAAAKQRDGNQVQAEAKPTGAHCASFTVSWASVGMCVGFKKPQPT